MASVSKALRHTHDVRTVDELALLRPASVDSLALRYFLDSDDIPRQHLRDAVDAAKVQLTEKEQLRLSLPPPPRSTNDGKVSPLILSFSHLNRRRGTTLVTTWRENMNHF